MNAKWLAIFTLSALPARAEPYVELVWQSRAEITTSIAQELQDLYLPLYNSGVMAVREARLGDRLVEQLLRDEGVFFGDHFPVQLDAMLCDMNAGLCSRVRTPASPKVLDTLTAHVGGYDPSYGNWRVNPSSEITIPDYRFESDTTLVRVPVPEDWTPGAYVASSDVDCTAWGQSCSDLVQSFNPKQFRSKTIEATLPQGRLTTRVTVDAGPSVKHKEVLSLASLAPAPGATVQRTILSDAFRSRDAAVSSVDWLVDSINGNLVPLGRVNKYTGSAEISLPQNASLLKAIHHPFAEGKEIPNLYRGPVTITVIDAAIDQGHCDWNKTHLASGEELPLIASATCSDVNAMPFSDSDHVAMVAGVIAAQPNGHGAVGINPYAELNFLQLDSTSAPDAQIDSLTDQLVLRIPLKTEIVNISAGFEKPSVGSMDKLRTAFTIGTGRTLFVVAAGNDNADLGEDCRIMPACLSAFDNVITVIGLNGNVEEPAIWTSSTTGSNYSPDFAIGAIAENVFSTVSGNQYGQRSGTSMAAPQVTAAASLILAASKRVWALELAGARIPPKFIKHRLIYTADILPGLAGKVLSGRLNVSRAMAVADDQFVLRDGRIITGQVQAAPDDFACRTPNQAEQIQKFYNLRRLTFMPDSERYVLFKHDTTELGARDAALVPFFGCNLTTLSPPVIVKTDLNELVEFKFGDILDYTSRFMETTE